MNEDINISNLMPKPEDETSKGLETLNPIIFNNQTYEVYGKRSDDKITFQSINFYHIYDGHDVILDIKSNIGKIESENQDIIASFRFSLKDGFFEIEKIKQTKDAIRISNCQADLMDDIHQIIRNYLLKNNSYLTELVEQADDNQDEIYSFNDRQKPSYDVAIAERFEKELAEKYESSFIKFYEDIMQDLILDETENMCKLTLASITVIIDRYSFILELLGNSGIGKSHVMKILLEHCIPDGYVLDFNSITESAFISYCNYDPKFYERLIINFGDLGDPEKMESLRDVLDIIKILITDKKYNRIKSEQNIKSKQWNEIAELHIKANSLGCIYGTVGNKGKNHSDVKGQRQSRTINCTPSDHSELELAEFSDNVGTYGTYGHQKYIKASEKMDEWKEYLKKRINEFDHDRFVLVMPFRHMFLELCKFSNVQIRDYNQIKTLLQTMSYVNFERSLKIKKDDKIFIIPCLDDVNDFIKIAYDSVGLKVFERNLLLKIKDEFQINFDILKNNAYLEYNIKDDDDSTLQDHYDNVIQEAMLSAESTVMRYDEAERDDAKGRNNNDFLFRNFEMLDMLLQKFGLNSKNRKSNKKYRQKIDAMKFEIEDDPKLEMKYDLEIKKCERQLYPQIFFTVTDFKRTFKNNSVVKNTPDMKETLNKFVEMGFLQKLPYKTSRNQNVYYVESQILQVERQYKMTKEDKLKAIQVLMQDFMVFDENDLQIVCKDYKVTLDEVKQFIEDQKQI